MQSVWEEEEEEDEDERESGVEWDWADMSWEERILITNATVRLDEGKATKAKGKEKGRGDWLVNRKWKRNGWYLGWLRGKEKKKLMKY